MCKIISAINTLELYEPVDDRSLDHQQARLLPKHLIDSYRLCVSRPQIFRRYIGLFFESSRWLADIPCIDPAERFVDENFIVRAKIFPVATMGNFRLNTKRRTNTGCRQVLDKNLRTSQLGTEANNNLSKLHSFFRKLANAVTPKVYA